MMKKYMHMQYTLIKILIIMLSFLEHYTYSMNKNVEFKSNVGWPLCATVTHGGVVSPRGLKFVTTIYPHILLKDLQNKNDTLISINGPCNESYFKFPNDTQILFDSDDFPRIVCLFHSLLLHYNKNTRQFDQIESGIKKLCETQYVPNMDHIHFMKKQPGSFNLDLYRRSLLSNGKEELLHEGKENRHMKSYFSCLGKIYYLDKEKGDQAQIYDVHERKCLIKVPGKEAYLTLAPQDEYIIGLEQADLQTMTAQCHIYSIATGQLEHTCSIPSDRYTPHSGSRFIYDANSHRLILVWNSGKSDNYDSVLHNTCMIHVIDAQTSSILKTYKNVPFPASVDVNNDYSKLLVTHPAAIRLYGLNNDSLQVEDVYYNPSEFSQLQDARFAKDNASMIVIRGFDQNIPSWQRVLQSASK